MSFSVMTLLLRSGPMATRSNASVTSFWVISLCELRAAMMAASLAMLARSAPEEPAALAARASRSTFLASGFLVKWTFRMASRSLRSGRPMLTRRSKRPGGAVPGPARRQRLVAASTMTFWPCSKAVHLYQNLVQGLLAFVVSAAHAGTAAASDGVDLVDEDDAGRVLLGFGEQVAHAARRRRRRTSLRIPNRRC